MNLAHNAVKFTPSGNVSISISQRDVAQKKVLYFAVESVSKIWDARIDWINKPILGDSYVRFIQLYG